MIEVTAERVRWFADYHARTPGWGVFHVAFEDGNLECGASDPDLLEVLEADVVEAVAWFDGLPEIAREELSRRVHALEQVRAQDRPAPTPRAEIPPKYLGSVLAMRADLAMRRESVAVDQLITGRLTETARRTYELLVEAVHVNGGEAPTIAEAMKGQRQGNANVFRARATELYYMGALVKSDLRTCKVSGRAALTWIPVAPPWTPIPGSRVGAATLRPLLRESAGLLVRAAEMIDRGASYDDEADLAAMLRARAAEYQTAASNTYTLSELSELKEL